MTIVEPFHSRLFAVILILVSFLSTTAFTDFFRKEDPVKIEFTPSGTAKPGSVIETQLELYIEHGFHLFSDKPEIKGVRPTSVELDPSDGYQVEKIIFPKPETTYSQVFQKNLGLYKDKAVISVYLKLKDQVSDKVAVKGALKYQACSDKVCYPPKSQSFSMVQAITR
jgi:DsbC/DsbD-like thiol-disulfide interchange protein